MTVGVWPNEFKHLDEWIDRVIAGLPSEFEIPLPGLELVDDEWKGRGLRVRTDDPPKACFERLDGVVPCRGRMGVPAVCAGPCQCKVITRTVGGCGCGVKELRGCGIDSPLKSPAGRRPH